jgi:hypothetical protein
LAVNRLLFVLILIWVTCLLASCASTGTTSSSPSTSISPTSSPSSTPTAVYTQYQLEYLLLVAYSDYFFCDPDFYPVVRPGQEQNNALQQFPSIQADTVEFSAILEHTGLADKPDYTDDEKLNIYREHKKLKYALQVTASGNIYQFTIRVGKDQGKSVTGNITPSGVITVLSQENSFNTCPICLSRGTLIDTPDGPVPVEQIQPGDVVWSVSSRGKHEAVTVLKTSATPVPNYFQMVELGLNDGRVVIASPGHPSKDFKTLGEYRVGDILDEARIISVEYIIYNGRNTYDLLPSGATGLYWANGILLHSTLSE